MKKEITYEELQAAASYVQARLPYTPKVALVLGSGLGDFADRLTIDAKIPYGEIPHFPVSTVAGHAGCFLLGKVGDCPVLIMKGRVHYYEGYSMQEVVMPVRVMHMLGAEILILTNAAGGMNPSYKPGTLVRITDQITSFVPSPLIGANMEALGTRFPDMSHVYDVELGKSWIQWRRRRELLWKKAFICRRPDQTMRHRRRSACTGHLVQIWLV